MPDWGLVALVGLGFWGTVLALNFSFIVFLVVTGHVPPIVPWDIAVFFALQGSLMAMWDEFARNHPRLLKEETVIFTVAAFLPPGIVGGTLGTPAAFAALFFWGGFVASIPIGHRIIFPSAPSA